MRVKLRWGTLLEKIYLEDREADGRWGFVAISLNHKTVLYFKLDHDHLLSHPFLFIIPYHCITSLTDSVVK
jgi:hypothetical protein